MSDPAPTMDAMSAPTSHPEWLPHGHVERLLVPGTVTYQVTPDGRQWRAVYTHPGGGTCERSISWATRDLAEQHYHLARTGFENDLPDLFTRVVTHGDEHRRATESRLRTHRTPWGTLLWFTSRGGDRWPHPRLRCSRLDRTIGVGWRDTYLSLGWHREATR